MFINKFVIFIYKLKIYFILLIILYIIFKFIYILNKNEDFPSKHQVFREYEHVCDPVVSALEVFHSKYGRYPQDLGGLVAKKLLDEIPRFPRFDHVTGHEFPFYRLNTELDIYALSFICYIPSEYGLGRTYCRVYISGIPKKWESHSLSLDIDNILTNRIRKDEGDVPNY